MYSIFQIIFCILAVICTAVTVFIFAYFNFWGFLPLGAAFVFGALMVTFKRLNEKKQLKENPPEPKGDFIYGKSDKE